ncbi:unnamed protein product [Pedinophyceae sp. YPF-701]|nr:unnamed protein product [Pedinophyceae sp. YPF-701]
MPLIYAFVSRGTDLLAEYTSYSGNFSAIAVKCVERLPPGNPRFTYTADRHTFNYLTEQGLTYCVVADQEYGRQIPFAFLERAKSDFQTRYGDADGVPADRIRKEFSPKLKEHMNWCMMNPEEIDKVAAVQKKVDEVRNVMVDNIEKVLERGERIEELVDKTDNLRYQADRFQKQSRQVRNQMCWGNVKVKIAVAVICLIVLLVVILGICSGVGCF